MLEVKAKSPDDFWNTRADAYVVTTNIVVKSNGENVMGGGVARQAADRLKTLPAIYGNALLMLSEYEQRHPYPREQVLKFRFTPSFGEANIICMPTKRHFMEPSPLNLVIKSMTQLVDIVDSTGWSRVHVPQPGCGLGGLDWEEVVKPFASRLFDDRFVVYGF